MKHISQKKQGKRWAPALLGAVSGFLNGLFGAGGGVAVVPMLEQLETPPQKAHATSVAVILPLSAATAALYALRGTEVDFRMLGFLAVFGVCGALIGAKCLRRIDQDLLRRIFGAVIVYSGIRNLLG